MSSRHEHPTCGDVKAGDLVVGDLVQVLAQTAEGVAVSHDQDLLSALDGGGDLVLPLDQEAVLRQLRPQTWPSKRDIGKGQTNHERATDIATCAAVRIPVVD